jgi:signal transduction histidine kinase/ActR/RegA family two-component response regulator
MHAGLWVATFDDITDRWRAEEAEADRTRALSEARLMREKERAAQETSRAKSLFLATMSHEIRTPMNAVLGLTSSLLDGPLDEEQRVVVTTIHESGESLLRILNDILDYSKLEAGRLELENSPFSPATLTGTLQAVMGPPAQAKALSFEVKTDSRLPSSLLGDSGRIQQILLNMVSNAVKFTDRGSVIVDARCSAPETGMASMEWRVHDTGIGIAADKIDSLFREFVQADGSINRRFGGSGLGLAICRRLAEQMGGTITVDSKPGEGSTFTFRVDLPIAAPPTGHFVVGPSPAIAIEQLIAHLGRPIRILIAEDNQTNQFVIRQMLKGFDIQVETANDGLEAISAVERSRHDAICMDVQMPDMDGLSATRMIRSKGGRQANVPIIALTGNAFQDDMRACLDAGMNAFIAKPVSKGQLLQTIVDEITRYDSVHGKDPECPFDRRDISGPTSNSTQPQPVEPITSGT